MVERVSPGPRLGVPALLLFASGAAGLIYQILWVKQLSLVVGVDVYAVTIAVSAFFAGLAFGSALFGKLADRSPQPLRLYALLELGIATLGVLATVALAHSGALFAQAEAVVGVVAWIIPLALVGIPASLMGGTVPVLARMVTGEGSGVAPAAGRLYAANTAGAVVGTLLCAFVLIRTLGVRGSGLAAASINLAVALAAFLLATHSVPARASPAPGPIAHARSDARLALGLYAVAGGIALGYEVIWSHAIVQWTGTRSFAFAIVLATYLVGLAAGSALGARYVGRLRDVWGAFGLLVAAAGLIALLELAALGAWLTPLQVKAATWAFEIAGGEGAAMSARFATAALCLVFVPTLILGAAFPVALRLGAQAENPGGSTGRLLALNTLGGIAGTLITGFVLVPVLAVERSLGALAILSGVVGGCAVLRGGRARRPWAWATLATGALAILATLLIAPDHLARLLAKAHGGELVFHEASAGGTVAVIEQGSGANRFRRLYIQGVSNSGDSLSSLRYMRLQGLLPLIIHRGEPRAALVIGLGTGITAGSLLRYPNLETRVCAELLPAVVRAAPHFSGNFDASRDQGVSIRIRDGRRELLRDLERYDLITLEPPPPSAAGVVNLYSRDFYALAAQRLQADGLFAQWLPLPTQTDDDTRSLVRSFLDAFPYATLWTTELHEMLLVGSMTPIELDTVRIKERFDQPEVAAALREVGVASPAALVATWVADRSGLERYVGDALPVTDDDPRIEYGAWVLPGDFPRTLSHLLAERSEPSLRGGDESFRIELAAYRERLLAFYQAGIYAYQDNRAGWAQSMQRVMSEESDNPYYRWIVGAGR
ncbi:MAG TPA: fused MFS/spermidine synthase [Steroidobacteraceae bacterium]|nr:fused MFS/spermidine synthase [Steroidobacteraceae bacterium]